MKSATASDSDINEKKYKVLFELIPEVIYGLDLNGHITTLSPSFKKITGWETKQWIGKHFSGLIHPDDLSLALKIFRHVIKGRKSPPYELRVRTKLGKIS